MSNNSVNEAMVDVTINTDNTIVTKVDTAPTIYDYTDLSADQKARINRLILDIGQAWHIVSPASPFPYQYHPDPNTLNWGIELLATLCCLAKMTGDQLSLKNQAVHYVCHSIEERNLDLDVIQGDYVIRLEDMDYAIRKMRNRINSYRPCRPGDRRGRTATSSLRRGRSSYDGRVGKERRRRG
ncbi:uncharacterized protein K460DRAFT_10290 [Cucurbitaria berberidis CBS 394.84]|uniref:Uncharacterized protein n=1 Tax=Cucurbitaria berberidis CBS 394.84 TaxID=1168544 RepID=A0A9P4GRL6_9PLEO|nr:uncharacterized protein K460DRAFT_10290 [Cucurbitaria berberidis CBS 394.84]KAF1850075.1 hypothetical protein K460DRAFT_10290 [Cucurbitaria berberidis CBS 394.84]